MDFRGVLIMESMANYISEEINGDVAHSDQGSTKRLLNKIRNNIDHYVEQITELQTILQHKEEKLIQLFSEEKRLLTELKEGSVFYSED
jgi:argonaute-like protein implicated in RNA metabolism and viral defense